MGTTHRPDARTRKIPIELHGFIGLLSEAGWTQRPLAKQFGVNQKSISMVLKGIRGECSTCHKPASEGKTRCTACNEKLTRRNREQRLTLEGWSRQGASHINCSARAMNLPVGTSRDDYPLGCSKPRTALGANFRADVTSAEVRAWAEPLVRPMPADSKFAGLDGVLCHDGVVRPAPWQTKLAVEIDAEFVRIELDHIIDGPECLRDGLEWNSFDNFQFMPGDKNRAKQHHAARARDAAAAEIELNVDRAVYKDKT